MDLLHIPLTCRPLLNGDLDVPYQSAIEQLVGYLNDAHVTYARTQGYMVAEVFCFAGAVICTSSTEAEFVVCVRGGKNT
jgi:hypothetical protein